MNFSSISSLWDKHLNHLLVINTLITHFILLQCR